MTSPRAAMQNLLARQKQADLRDGAPDLALRKDRLDRCIGLLVDHRGASEDALNADFGSRSREATAFTDIGASIGPLKALRPPYGPGIAKFLAGQIRR